MPAYSPIDILLRLQMVNLQMLQQLNTTLMQTQALTGRAQVGMNGLTGSISRGVGTFYVMRRALQAANAMIRTGIENSQDWELALTGLGIAINENGTRLQNLGNIAEDVAMQIGPLAGVEVIEGMRALGQTIGATTNRVAALAKPMGQLVSNMVELSRHEVTPRGAEILTRNVLNLFGGIQDVDQARKIMELWQGATAGFAPEAPGKMFTALQKIVPVMRFLGMSPENIFTLGAVATAMPTTARGGTDVRRFFEQIAGARGLMSKRGRNAKEQVAALAAMGFLPEGHSSLMAGGVADPIAMANRMISLQRQGGMSIEDVAIATQKAFPSALPRSFYMFLASNPNVLGQVREHLGRMQSIEQILDTLQHTSKYSFDLLIQDLKQLSVRIFELPTALLGRVARFGAGVATQGVMDMRAVPHLGGLAGIGAMGLAGGTSLSLMALFLRGMAAFAGGLGTFGTIGTALLSLTGNLLLTAGVLGLAATAGLELYQHSKLVRQAIHDNINSWQSIHHEIRIGQHSLHVASIRIQHVFHVLVNWMMWLEQTVGSWIAPFHGMYGELSPAPSMRHRGGHFAVAPFVAPPSTIGAPEPPTPAAPGNVHAGVRTRALTGMAIDRIIGNAIQHALKEMGTTSMSGADPLANAGMPPLRRGMTTGQ